MLDVVPSSMLSAIFIEYNAIAWRLNRSLAQNQDLKLLWYDWIGLQMTSVCGDNHHKYDEGDSGPKTNSKRWQRENSILLKKEFCGEGPR
jgi:hypothetical protein